MRQHAPFPFLKDNDQWHHTQSAWQPQNIEDYRVEAVPIQDRPLTPREVQLFTGVHLGAGDER